MSEELQEKKLPYIIGEPRNSQWCKFRLPEAETKELIAFGAHVSSDGHFVGVFVRGGVDGLGTVHVSRIEPVNKVGNKTTYLSPDGQTVLIAQINPTAAIDLHSMTSRDDVPAARLARMNLDWVPQA